MLVVILMLTSTSTVFPYARTTSTLNEYTYEGFATIDAIKTNIKAATDSVKDFSIDESKDVEFSKLRTTFAETADKIITMISTEDANPAVKASDVKKNDESSKTESFATLNGTSYASVDPQTIDIFSSAVGSPTCVNKSSGLSNSTGSLCLTDNMKAMLHTRGGNSSDVDSQIGGK